MLEDWIMSNDIFVNNIGSMPTFRTSRASSIIDITLTNSVTDNLVTNWRVSPKTQFSDHMRIDYEFETKNKASKPFRNYKKVDWGVFTPTLDNFKWQCPDSWDIPTLEAEAELLNSHIWQILDEISPKYTPKAKKSYPEWWTEEATVAMRKARALYKKAVRHNRDPVLWAQYQEARGCLRQLTRKGKYESYKSFVTKTETISDMSKLYKIIQRKENNQLGLLKRSDNSFVESPEETVGMLLNEHFPGSSPGTVTDEIPFSQGRSVPSSAMEDCFIQPDIVSRAINSFEAGKAVGPDEVPPIILHNLGPMAIKRVTWIYRDRKSVV
jgi:hypothetical protein